MTEEEQAEVGRMVDEFEAVLDSGKPGARVAWFKLKQLANTTGDEWETLARQYLAERAAQRTNLQQSGE